jgi:putative transposase
MKGFRSAGGAHRFPSCFSAISQHFRPRRHRLTAAGYRQETAARCATWNEIVGLTVTA